MAYQKINWANGEAGNTPLNANNLNKMDDALDDFESRIGDAEYQIATLETTTSGLTTEVNKKLNKLNPSVSGTLTSTTIKVSEIMALDSSYGVEVEKDVIVTRGSTEYHVVDNLIQFENYITNTLTPNVRQNTDDISTNANAIRTISVDLELLSGTVRGQGETIGEHTLSIAALSEQTTTNTEAIATNTADITTLKNAGIISLTSTSPLLTSTASTINGIDALGESKQDGTPTPTNPISIVDCSGVVKAHNHNFAFKEIDGNYINASGVIESGTYSVMVAKVEQGKTYRAYGMDGTCVFAFYTSEPNVGSVSYNNSRTTQAVGTSDYGIISAPIDGYAAVRVARNTQYMLTLGTSDMDYVAYASNTITLPTLRSVGDVKDELIVNADGSGQIVRRVGKTTLNVTLSAGTSKAMALSGISNAYGRLSIISDCFPCAYSGDNYICVNSAYSGLVMQSATDYSGDVVVYYPLATPTTTTLTTSEVASILALKTYDGTTIVDSELDVTIDYVGDTKGYIDSKFDYLYDLIRQYHPETISVLSEGE